MRPDFVPPPAKQISTFKLSKKRTRRHLGLGAIIAIMVALVAFPGSAAGQTLSVLYSFTGQIDGGLPDASLTRDMAGDLFGTTAGGGTFGWGTLFKLDSSGNETVLYSFTGGADGSSPESSLIRDAAGNLYGTTSGGGISTCNFGSGCGTVFKLANTGKLTVLHAFTDSPDGSVPMGRLVRDAKGNLYGTTVFGGTSSSGIVFKLDSTGKETVLHRFNGLRDGQGPNGGLVRDAAGNLYGTTLGGGTSSAGTVFKVNSSGKETVLYTFNGASDGAVPLAGLIQDATGNLYGTASLGGVEACPGGCGLVFKLDSTGKETVLHTFTGGSDGISPYASVIRDAAGNLYGTTRKGGTLNAGTVFELDATGKETVLHTFAGGTDGGDPIAGLTRDAAGNLYGTTSNGGTSFAGSVFKLAP